MVAPSPAASRGVCERAGLSPELAAAAFGHSAKLVPYSEPGNAPSSIANVPACFVSVKGAVVATVRRYSSRAWPRLMAIYAKMKPRPHRVGLGGLGRGAALFDVVVDPASYEEDLVFHTGRAVLTVRSAAVSSARAPAEPLRSLASLAHGMYRNLASE